MFGDDWFRICLFNLPYTCNTLHALLSDQYFMKRIPKKFFSKKIALAKRDNARLAEGNQAYAILLFECRLDKFISARNLCLSTMLCCSRQGGRAAGARNIRGGSTW